MQPGKPHVVASRQEVCKAASVRRAKGSLRGGRREVADGSKHLVGLRPEATTLDSIGHRQANPAG